MIPGLSPLSFSNIAGDAFAPGIAGDATPEEAAEELRRAKAFSENATSMGLLFGAAAALLLTATKSRR